MQLKQQATASRLYRVMALCVAPQLLCAFGLITCAMQVLMQVSAEQDVLNFEHKCIS